MAIIICVLLWGVNFLCCFYGAAAMNLDGTTCLSLFLPVTLVLSIASTFIYCMMDIKKTKKKISSGEWPEKAIGVKGYQTNLSISRFMRIFVLMCFCWIPIYKGLTGVDATYYVIGIVGVFEILFDIARCSETKAIKAAIADHQKLHAEEGKSE